MSCLISPETACDQTEDFAGNQNNAVLDFGAVRGPMMQQLTRKERQQLGALCIPGIIGIIVIILMIMFINLKNDIMIITNNNNNETITTTGIPRLIAN